MDVMDGKDGMDVMDGMDVKDVKDKLPPWQPRRDAGAIHPVHENSAPAFGLGMAFPLRNKPGTMA